MSFFANSFAYLRDFFGFTGEGQFEICAIENNFHNQLANKGVRYLVPARTEGLAEALIFWKCIMGCTFFAPFLNGVLFGQPRQRLDRRQKGWLSAPASA